MAETAVNVPFDSNEIKEIVCSELRKRLDSLGPLQGAKEYSSFDIGFNVTIRLRTSGNTASPKETLAWGKAKGGMVNPDHQEVLSAANDNFTSGDPNEERLARDMPLTVESKDGRGNIVRRKVNVKE